MIDSWTLSIRRSWGRKECATRYKRIEVRWAPGLDRNHRGLPEYERGLKLGSLGPELVITIGSLFPRSRLKEAGLSALPVSDP